jgi:hypothetical protein
MGRSKMTQFDCFFSLQNEPSVGSCMEMEITLPQELAGSARAKVFCQGKVIQVEKEKSNGRTGVVCSVENYHFMPASSEEKLVE